MSFDYRFSHLNLVSNPDRTDKAVLFEGKLRTAPWSWHTAWCQVHITGQKTFFLNCPTLQADTSSLFHSPSPAGCRMSDPSSACWQLPSVSGRPLWCPVWAPRRFPLKNRKLVLSVSLHQLLAQHLDRSSAELLRFSNRFLTKINKFYTTCSHLKQ